MSFALLSASMRWSSERTGASAWVLGDTIRAHESNKWPIAVNHPLSRVFLRCRNGQQRAVRERVGLAEIAQVTSFELGRKLRADACGCVRIGEENRAEGDVKGACGGEVEHVASGRDAPHADDRELRRAVARVHR